MARINVRYLTVRSGAGGVPRYFWQPSAALRAAGWRSERVPLDWQRHHDAAELHAAAIARAEELNRHLDATRDSRALASAAGPAAAPPATDRTLGALLAAYERGSDFAGLRPRTKVGYRQCLSKLDAWGHDAPVRAITAVRVEALRDALRATPAYANACIRVLRLVLEWGRRKGWLMVNPAVRPHLLASEPAGIIWPREAVAAFVALADRRGLASIGTAVLLNEWLGQREGDILRMPRHAWRNGRLVLRQSKTGAVVALPVSMVPHLHARLEATMAAHAAREAAGRLPVTTVLIAESTGRPWAGDHFRHAFARLRAELAREHPRFTTEHLLPGQDMTDPHAYTVATTDLTFMALRHTAVTRLSEAGCDVMQIASITGHAEATVVPLLKRYMIRTAAIARTAFGQRLAAEGIAASEQPGNRQSDNYSDKL